jgi:multiple sugar transport system permease protein
VSLRAEPRVRSTIRGAGPGTALPYLLLAPSLFVVLTVLVYPLWDGVKASLYFYRYGKPLRFVGFDNYILLWTDSQYLNSLVVTLKFVTLSVAIETVLGLALALFCLREFRGIRLLRTVLIVPMVITPVVVAIVFRLSMPATPACSPRSRKRSVANRCRS